MHGGSEQVSLKLNFLILVQGNFPATCILLGVLNVHLTSWGVNEALHFTFEKTGTDQKVADTKNFKSF